MQSSRRSQTAAKGTEAAVFLFSKKEPCNHYGCRVFLELLSGFEPPVSPLPTGWESSTSCVSRLSVLFSRKRWGRRHSFLRPLLSPCEAACGATNDFRCIFWQEQRSVRLIVFPSHSSAIIKRWIYVVTYRDVKNRKPVLKRTGLLYCIVIRLCFHHTISAWSDHYCHHKTISVVNSPRNIGICLISC